MPDESPLSWSLARPGGLHTPLLTENLPGIGGYLSMLPEDFCVHEELPYEPEGSGDHFFVHIQKRGISTSEVIRCLAEAAGVHQRDVGYAGRKDVHAIATQWISMPTEPKEIDDERFSVIEVKQHNKKLRVGHVKQNRFNIRVRDVDQDALSKVEALMAILSEGFPNYFGVQRFGRSGRNLETANRWIGRGCPRIKGPKFMVSVVQSAVFNAWLGDRVRDKLFDSVLPGDILRKRETGGLFMSEDVEIDQARLESGEIDVCGPLFGPKMKQGGDRAKAREEEWVSRLQLTSAARRVIAKFGAGGRRLARITAGNFNVEVDGTDLLFCFTLPSGVYATVFLAELMHPSDGWVDRVSLSE
ncbi:MAG: tRNA pseudouridine(13) synthase TruD [Bradymonadia bacterium]